ncbi:uncharacterized protein Tco025E_09056 [Trypanosoma conorhini]|uniref:Uncharacterized protein n=1 Tax=Trypanosoma conorhini TaxID=83891 RepID=A0A3R7RB84_9TRYP|nr:uncharacterized protein Tco025E_09056 [Trypanosoma conorhini]RNE99208.1 hypothetical protein Tco025E_09056 [Trypanosoma conorhini]
MEPFFFSCLPFTIWSRAFLQGTLERAAMVSKDSRYVHRRWRLEDATLMIQNPKLELLVDFDDPASFTLPANAPLTSGVRRTTATRGGVEGALSLNSEDDLLADWREIGVPPLAEE